MNDDLRNALTHWSAWEDEMLHKGYGIIDTRLLAKMFGRSYGAIRFRAHALGIKVALPIKKRVGLQDYKGDDAIARAYIRGYEDGYRAAQQEKP